MHLLRPVALLMFALILAASLAVCEQHVIIVVMDGVRYSESLGAKETYMPHVWNDLRPQGAIFTNFRNEGWTITCPGFSSILTGNWQHIANDGSQPFSDPTIFEAYRKATGAPEQSCLVVSGKAKLHVLTHSTDTAYGEQDGASFVSNKTGDNLETYKNLLADMQAFHPHLVIVNLAETDLLGHAGKWEEYLAAIRQADSLLEDLWNVIQSDPVYKNTTTLFVTNDHGRHDDQHGGFKNHGDSCEGCRHIMLLALGPRFQAGSVVTDTAYQVDIAPTAAELLEFPFGNVTGKSLLRPRPGAPKQ